MRPAVSLLALISVSSNGFVESFMLEHRRLSRNTQPSMELFSAPEPAAADEEEDAPQGLILSQEEVDQQMSKLRSKYPTGEADYLAAARARSAAKTPSRDCEATDEDWKEMAEKKKEQVGQVDDWENSKKEAGNLDSQILIPMGVSEDGEDDEEEEPKLMLF